VTRREGVEELLAAQEAAGLPAVVAGSFATTICCMERSSAPAAFRKGHAPLFADTARFSWCYPHAFLIFGCHCVLLSVIAAIGTAVPSAMLLAAGLLAFFVAATAGVGALASFMNAGPFSFLPRCSLE
jgi:hypothetical protein